jgi:hypothetical protein
VKITPPAGRVYLDVDGNRIINVTGLNLSDFCITQDAGQYSVGERFDDPPFADLPTQGSGGDVTFTEPGEYTLESPTDTATITVEEQPFDPSLVDSTCSITAPDIVTPGDQVTLTATVSNGNGSSAPVTVTFSFGSDEETTGISVPANGSSEASVTFVPDEPGQYSPEVVHTVEMNQPA